MKQEYENYSSDDHSRWAILMKRKEKLLEKASRDFLEGYERVGLPENRVPSFEEINEILIPATGWQYEAGDEGNMASFFEALSRRVFPSAVQVRPWEELSFCKLPDIFHDVFGHAGLLLSQPFADFLEELGKLGVQYSYSEKALRFLASIYWYTAEVGLIQEDDILKYYGGSVISSASEIETVYSAASMKKEYSVLETGHTSYDSYEVNNVYYRIDDMSTLNKSLSEIRESLLQYDLSSSKVLR